MIRYSGLKINIAHTEEDIRLALTKKLRVKPVKLLNFTIVKRSLDARDKNHIHWNYIIDFATDKDREVLKVNKGRPEFSTPKNREYRLPMQGNLPYDRMEHGRICVVGSGPAGLFAAYFLAEQGFAPILIERGAPVEERMETVRSFWEETSQLDPNSNIQFGEGGAGTFSDGKLNTGVNDPSGRNHLVLSTFVQNGAPKEILYDNKPHIGSDVLITVIRNMRNKIIENGGEVFFHSLFETADYDSSLQLVSISVKDLKNGQVHVIPCRNLILATGHSARDTFEYLIRKTPLKIEAKPFSVGVRIQHLQECINRAQYGDSYASKYPGQLPPADYKLSRHTDDGHNIYSFCMCPGGYVVNSSSEEGRLCINGMSYSGRAGTNANAAIVVAVQPSKDPLENISYQRGLEEKAFRAAGGRIPVQRFADFEQHTSSEGFGTVLPECKGAYQFADLHQILDEELSSLITDSIHAFANRIKGFDNPDALLSAVESRTSSPIRILRNEDLESDIRGIYPCGEGAGYAGGITSAAIDGIKVFEKIYQKYTILKQDLWSPFE